MTTKLRPIAEPFVVAPPAGARIRTRLRVFGDDQAVLMALGTHLGSLMGRDLGQRCREGRLDARGRSASRARRKRALTRESSSRWAGAITRSSEDAWQLGQRNLAAQAGSEPTRGWARESYQLRCAALTGQHCRPAQGPSKESQRPKGQRAAAPAAQDPTGRPESPG